MALITAIVPTYNRTRLLMDRCLPSIFAQTVPSHEVLVIGDGTESATARAIRRLNHPAVRFWNLPHADYPEDHRTRWGVIGLPSLNFGLGQATGEWIAVLADDDEWLPEHNEILLGEAERSGADHVYGISQTFKDGRMTGQVYGRWPPSADGAFCNGANLYRSALPYRYDMDCGSRGRTGDHDLWLRMLDDGVRFSFVSRVVHRYFRNFP
jgi:glycosyltransferase involved in cell wall biosynthesis